MEDLNFFEPNDGFYARRIQSVNSVIDGLELAASGHTPAFKVVAPRYRAGLSEVPSDALAALRERLVTYRAAVASAPAPVPNGP